MKFLPPVSSFRNLLLLSSLGLTGVTDIGAGHAFGMAVQGSPAEPERLTHTYIGTITSSNGPQAGLLPVGATIIVSPTVNLAVTDSEPDPEHGEYEDGVISLKVELPTAGFSVLTGTGFVGVGNNYGLLDELDNVHYYGSNDIVGSLGTHPVQFVALSFLEVAAAGSSPTMIDSDAIPTAPIETGSVTLDIVANAEYNYLTLALEPVPTVAESVQDAAERIGALVASGRLDPGVGRSLLAKLAAVRAASEVRTNAACGAFTGLGNQVAHFPRRSPDEMAVGAELDALLLVLGAALGGC